MPRGVQVTIVTSLRGRFHFFFFFFFESLKVITLNIFFENERIRLYICIVVEQEYMCMYPEKVYSF